MAGRNPSFYISMNPDLYKKLDRECRRLSLTKAAYGCIAIAEKLERVEMADRLPETLQILRRACDVAELQAKSTTQDTDTPPAIPPAGGEEKGSA